MLRQLYMTLSFSQVVPSLSLTNSSHFKNLKTDYTQNSKILNIESSCFLLFPYISPKSPYPPIPYSMQKLPRHFRQERIYNDLEQLDNHQLKDFLRSYQAFKYRNFGTKNPTNITNPFYQWVIKHNLDVWSIQKILIDPYIEEKLGALPRWSQARMGQSRTVLSDGRIILIAGEYEDYYDPNFCIYNDVSVIHTDGTIEIYNYLKTVFPPTDFHTATLVSQGEHEHIIIIGSLGYPDERQYTHTPVYRLNTQNFKIEQVATRNSMGWIGSHTATLKDNQIIITGGQFLIDETTPLLENIDTWVLNLNTLIWKNTTNLDRKWQRFYVKRQDDKCLSLWEYEQLAYAVDFNDHQQVKKYSKTIEDLIGVLPDLDSYRLLLIPPINHETIDLDGKKNATHYDKTLYINEVKVGYKTADDSCIQVTIEGKLSEDKLELLQQNLRHRLSKVENMACEIIDISSK